MYYFLKHLNGYEVTTNIMKLIMTADHNIHK